MAFAIKPGSTVLFTGDSITDTGRRDANVPLGNGYVRMCADLITARYPDHKINVLNTGISGNTVRDLFNRWSDDVIRHQPDWLSIMIGINDANRLCNGNEAIGVKHEQYAELYPQLLERVKKETKAQLILIEPFFISTDTTAGSYRSNVLSLLPKYQATAQQVAKRYKARYVRFHVMFQRLLKIHSADRFCPEPIHPNPTGHLMMAHEWLRTVGW